MLAVYITIVIVPKLSWCSICLQSVQHAATGRISCCIFSLHQTLLVFYTEFVLWYTFLWILMFLIYLRYRERFVSYCFAQLLHYLCPRFGAQQSKWCESHCTQLRHHLLYMSKTRMYHLLERALQFSPWVKADAGPTWYMNGMGALNQTRLNLDRVGDLKCHEHSLG